MALESGTRFGSYEIVSPLGVGGMGEVYRARDLELGRTVAIKILRPEKDTTAEQHRRLRREAQLLAALNHPHIAQIYGLAEVNDARGLVLEFVEGETLAERLTRMAGSKDAALRVREALSIALQIADALEAAHAQGIVHRDLKPANVKITPAGVVKVLDFGIAKFAGPKDPTVSDTQAATRTETMEHGIFGTAAYMSPEQARGLPVDRRSDVWAFGCVLYELLTAKKAFEATTMTETLAAVLEREPDWTLLPAETPAEIQRLLRRCLQKNPAERLRDIGDVRLLIEDARHASAPAPPVPPVRKGSRIRWITAGAFVVLAATAGVLVLRNRSSAPAETGRFSLSTPGPITPQLSAAISPDGRQVAFVATDASGKAMLWVRALNQLQARELPGTERAAHPFWSPDGRTLGFIADNKIKRVDLAGGPAQTILQLQTGGRFGPAWGPDGTILFNARTDQIAAVPAAGGTVTPVVTADPAKEQGALLWPRFLPDGRHFIYVAQSRRPEYRGIYVGSLDSKDSRLVLNNDLRAWYAPPGYLVFARDETLMAQPFDAARLELSGEPRAIAEGVWFAQSASQASFSVSETGVLAYVNASLWNAELSWFDRQGHPLGAVGRPDRYGMTPRISPDSRRIAIGRGEFQREDNWIIDLATGASSRLNFTPEGDGAPIWASDGRRVMYNTGPRVFVKNVDSGEETEIFVLKSYATVEDWSSDGRFVVLSLTTGTNLNLWTVDLKGNRTPVQFLDTPYNEAQAQLSPDGHWIAYTANESGRDEVYVQSFPVPGRTRQISTEGGAMPRWRRDGGELFYLAANQFITAVPVKNKTSLELGPAVPLFKTRLVVQGSESVGLPTTYDVAPDGQRFVLRYPPTDPEPPITVVLNWMATLRK
jgi:eukaryotic-like serine/threonine-protein kinase